jgi:hypothetical protein
MGNMSANIYGFIACISNLSANSYISYCLYGQSISKLSYWLYCLYQQSISKFIKMYVIACISNLSANSIKRKVFPIACIGNLSAKPYMSYCLYKQSISKSLLVIARIGQSISKHPNTICQNSVICMDNLSAKLHSQALPA